MTRVTDDKLPPVYRGFYVHYKGGIYFVHGGSFNDDTKESLVIYSSIQGCGAGAETLRHRTVVDFFTVVNLEDGTPWDGKSSLSFTARRFRRVIEWRDGRPVVENEVTGELHTFTPYHFDPDEAPAVKKANWVEGSDVYIDRTLEKWLAVRRLPPRTR